MLKVVFVSAAIGASMAGSALAAYTAPVLPMIEGGPKPLGYPVRFEYREGDICHQVHEDYVPAQVGDRFSWQSSVWVSPASCPTLIVPRP